MREPRSTPSRAIAPPLSPPPTSPLPPTPVPDLFLVTNHWAPPPRPPRPQTSLPDLRPRTIVSPEPGQRVLRYRLATPEPARYSCLQSPFTTPSQSFSIWDVPTGMQLSNRPSPEPQLEISASFTDTVLAALPQLSSPPNSLRAFPFISDKSNAWPFTLSSPRLSTRLKTKTVRSTKPPRKDVARSALFIPSPTASSTDLSHQDEPLLFPQPERTISTPLWEDDDDNIITSLPPITSMTSSNAPNDPSSLYNSHHAHIQLPSRSPLRPLRSLHSTPSSDMRPEQDITVGYPTRPVTNLEIETRHIDNNNNGNSNDKEDLPGTRTGVMGGTYAPRSNTGRNIVAINGDENILTPHQSWYIRRRRYIWMLATLVVILVAAAGVLGGMIWRLSRE
jgi:hypothetical protein